jgi:hypothetical protein
LLGLHAIMQDVFKGALEPEPGPDGKQVTNEIQHNISRFCGHIKTSIQQAYGNVTISVPEIPEDMIDEHAVISDGPLMILLTNAVVSTFQPVDFCPQVSLYALKAKLSIFWVLIFEFYFF